MTDPALAKAASERGNLQKRLCLLGLFLAWTVGYADRFVMNTAIIPISQEFSLGPQQAGLLLSAFHVSYAFMQLAGGWLSDRYGSRIVVVTCIALWSMFTGATSLAWSFGSFFLVRFLFGIGEGSFSPASSVTVAEVFPKQERARAKSFLISTTFLGNAAGSSLVGFTVLYLGWRGSFRILAVVGVLVAMLLWLALKAGAAGQQRAREAKRPHLPWRALLRTPMVWRLATIWFLISVVYTGTQAWMPTYLFRTYAIDLPHIGLASALPNLIAFFGTNVVGYVLDKHGQRYERHLLVVGSFLSGIFLLLMVSTASPPLLVAYWSGFVLAFNCVYATVFAAPLRHFPDHLIGSATGVMNFGGQIGGAVAPSAAGMLVAAYGGSFIGSFGLFLACAALSVLVSLTWRHGMQTAGLADG